MNGEEAWIGLCHFYEGEGAARTNFEAHAAVWCEGREGFDAELGRHLAGSGYRLLWSEEVHPAVQWQSRFPRERGALNLARSVHPGRPVEIGMRRELATPEPPRVAEKIVGAEPFDAQFGVWPKKTVPDVLVDPLFGQPEPTKAEIAYFGSADAVPPLGTYAILDAAKARLLPEMLQSSGLEFRCLFKGAAEVELRNLAPYIVVLEQDNVLMRQLFTRSGMPSDLWLKDTGFYIRTHDSLDQLWRHFRKFTRLQDENGKWFYFRFWETNLHPALLKARKDDSLFAKLASHHGFVLRNRRDPTLFHYLRGEY
ncbi:MAG: DUF4123 domain-containing protein [Rhizobiaceae bacterium]|nr:DUF4123 domain-containing protein [Rhizobiaceae bacterium]